MKAQIHNTETAFREWMGLLKKTEQLGPATKKALIDYLEVNRHVMIVDVRRFFIDALPADDKRSSDYPIGLLSRGLPLVLLDSYEDVGDAIRFCKSAGFTYELHCYHGCFFQTIQQ